jgi:ABC-type dipeptide/oligopeptide/nickel transport system permease component
MAAFVGRRIAARSALLLGVALLVLALDAGAPADPGGGWSGYLDRVGGVLRGDLGRSHDAERPVAELLGARLSASLRLALAATTLALFAGVAAGTLAAVRPGGATDGLLMAGATLGIAAPAVWLGLMLSVVFAVWLAWLPVAGDGSWRHLVLPALTLGARPAGAIARTARAALLDALAQGYVLTARAKGVPAAAILRRHAARNALVPVIAVTGLGLPGVLLGTPLAEAVFAWPGLGGLLVTAALQRDLPVVTGALLLLAALHVAAMLLADLAGGLADPRFRA